MNQGKAQCELLKEIRSQIAIQNGIQYETSECGFEGDCKGTCPKCETELKFIEQQLIKRKKSGKSILISGITAGIITTMMSSCQEKPNTPIQNEMKQIDTTQVDMSVFLKDTNIIFEPQITILTTIGFSVPIEEELPERIPDTIEFIEEIPESFPFDSTVLKIDTL